MIHSAPKAIHAHPRQSPIRWLCFQPVPLDYCSLVIGVCAFFVSFGSGMPMNGLSVIPPYSEVVASAHMGLHICALKGLHGCGILNVLLPTVLFAAPWFVQDPGFIQAKRCCI
jgi:hypothetical protein